MVGLDWEGLDLRGEIEWEIRGSGETSRREIVFFLPIFTYFKSVSCDDDLCFF